MSDNISYLSYIYGGNLAKAMAIKWDWEMSKEVNIEKELASEIKDAPFVVNSTPYQTKGDCMENPSRVTTIEIIPQTSGVVVAVTYKRPDKRQFIDLRGVTERYSCITQAEANEVVEDFLGEVYEAQEDYFAPEPGDEPVKRKRKRRVSRV